MQNYVITIGRQHGCGGRIIGKKLAEKLGINYYDKNILSGLIAEDCGIAKETVDEMMEKHTSSFLYEIASFGKEGPLEEQIYLSKNKIMNKLADEGSCVIVGACADYILRDRKNLLTVFLYGEPESRIKRIVEVYKDASSMTEHQLKLVDRKRANYYHFFTTKKWGDRKNYDLLINTELGIDNVTDMLAKMAIERFGGEVNG